MRLYLLKEHMRTFLSIPITQKCQILSCDTHVANEQYEIVNRKIISFFLLTSFFMDRYFNMPPKENKEKCKKSADVEISL